jgi:hypothetical protein
MPTNSAMPFDATRETLDDLKPGVIIMLQTSLPAHATRVFRAFAGLVLACASFGAAAQSMPALRLPDIAGLLPAPPDPDRSGTLPCVTGGVPQTEGVNLDSEPPYRGPFLEWSHRHFKFQRTRDIRCVMDWALVVRQWQAAVGTSQTGVFGQEDLAKLRALVDEARPRAMAAFEANSKARVDTRQRIEEAKERELAEIRRGSIDLFGLTVGLAVPLPACQRQSPQPATCVRFDAPDGFGARSWLGDTFEEGRVLFAQREIPSILAGSGSELKIQVLRSTRQLVLIEFPTRFDEPEARRQYVGKFGEPATRTVQMVNRRGATWEGQIHTWQRPHATLVVECTSFERRCVTQAQSSLVKQTVEQRRRERSPDARPL